MIERTFKVDASPEIDVHIPSGRIEIRAGESGSVHVVVDTQDPEFIVEQRGDQVHISSSPRSGWASARQSFVVVEVPVMTDATVGVASANVECRVEMRRLSVKTASGNIDFDKAHDANIKTASGDANIGLVANDLLVNTASGDLHVQESQGKVSFSSASGDLRIEEAHGPINASTASGDVSLGRFTGRQAVFKSMSGEIEIGLPAGTKVDLDATLMSGRLNTPPPSDGPSVSTRQVSVRAKLVSGDLTINRVDD